MRPQIIVTMCVVGIITVIGQEVYESGLSAGLQESQSKIHRQDHKLNTLVEFNHRINAELKLCRQQLRTIELEMGRRGFAVYTPASGGLSRITRAREDPRYYVAETLKDHCDILYAIPQGFWDNSDTSVLQFTQAGCIFTLHKDYIVIQQEGDSQQFQLSYCDDNFTAVLIDIVGELTETTGEPS